MEYLWNEQDPEVPAQDESPSPPSGSPDLVRDFEKENSNDATGPATRAKKSLSKRIVDWDPISINPIGEKDDLENLRRTSSKRKVIQAIETVVDSYGPIPEMQLLSSVSRAFGVRRMSKGIRQKIKNQIPNAEIFQGRDKFYWPKGVDITKWRLFRYDPTAKRQVVDISPYELKNLVEVLIQNESFEHDEKTLLRRLGKVFGLQRVKGHTRTRFKEAIMLSIEQASLTTHQDNKIGVLTD